MNFKILTIITLFTCNLFCGDMHQRHLNLIIEADQRTQHVDRVVASEHPSMISKVVKQAAEYIAKPPRQYTPDSTVSYASDAYHSSHAQQPTVNVHNHQTVYTPVQPSVQPEPIVHVIPVVQPVKIESESIITPAIVVTEHKIVDPAFKSNKTNLIIMIGSGLVAIGGIIFGYVKSKELKEYKKSNLSRIELTEKLRETEAAMVVIKNQISTLVNDNNLKARDIATLRKELAELNDLTIRLRNALAEANNLR